MVRATAVCLIRKNRTTRIGESAEEWHFTLRERLSLTRCSFPQAGNSNESWHQVYRHGRAQGSDRDRGAEWPGESGNGVDRGNQSQQHSAVYPRSRGEFSWGEYKANTSRQRIWFRPGA